MKMETANAFSLKARAVEAWKEDVKDAEKWFILDKLEILESAIDRVEALLDEATELHNQAVKERGGWDARYEGRECDMAEIETEFALQRLQREHAELDKELTKILRKARKLGIA